MARYFTEKNYALIDLLEQRGKAVGASVAQMALAWMLQRKAMTAPIIGANSPEQLNELLGSLEVKLTLEDVEAIDQASDWNQ